MTCVHGNPTSERVRSRWPLWRLMMLGCIGEILVQEPVKNQVLAGPSSPSEDKAMLCTVSHPYPFPHHILLSFMYIHTHIYIYNIYIYIYIHTINLWFGSGRFGQMLLWPDSDLPSHHDAGFRAVVGQIGFQF